ncbi:MAG TPA: diacylglycerol kinase family protein [Gemmatimonadaceae bacterium]|nr:diacylglycerol kinase family protein [Gemmatimonadaceae bacterium]
MRVLLFHNPGAGHRRHTRADLVSAFERAGHDVTYQSVKRKGWKKAFETVSDVIVAAGGDGAVRRVATALADRNDSSNATLVIVPIGTANNIARALGAEGSAAAIAKRIPAGRMTRLAVGTARSAWGEMRFVEAVGLGAFAVMLREAEKAKKEKKKSGAQHRTASIDAGIDHLQAVASRIEARHVRVKADGEDLSGDYLLVEAMNIPSIGSCVDLARADYTDDRLELVLVREEERTTLVRYLAKIGACEPFDPPFQSRQARRVVLHWPPDDGHVDDAPWPEEENRSGGPSSVTVEIDRWIPVLVPNAE